MAKASNKALCSICNKEKIVYKCQGCWKDFCLIHLPEHRQILSQQLDESETNRDQLQQMIFEQNRNMESNHLMKRINEWERNSIEKIRQTAEECRQSLNKYLNKSIDQIEHQLNLLTEQLKGIRQDNEFTEIDLNPIKNKLKQLTHEFHQPSTISLREHSSSSLFINKISIISSLEEFKWQQQAVTVAGGHGEGIQLNQVYFPYGISIDPEKTIYIADWDNHRVVQWKFNEDKGQLIAGGKGKGNGNNQLSYPRHVIVDKQNDSIIIADHGNRRVIRWLGQKTLQVLISNIDCWGLAIDKHRAIYICDLERNEVRRWKIGETHGTIVAGGNGQGNQLNQLFYPTYMFINDEDESIYISDSDNHRVVKWRKGAKEGIVVAGGNGKGNSPRQFSNPRGVVADGLGQIYVVDYGNHRVMRWREGGSEGEVIVGGKGRGDQANQLSYPSGLAVDAEGNLYVADHENHRIQKFAKCV